MIAAGVSVLHELALSVDDWSLVEMVYISMQRVATAEKRDDFAGAELARKEFSGRQACQRRASAAHPVSMPVNTASTSSGPLLERSEG